MTDETAAVLWADCREHRDKEGGQTGSRVQARQCGGCSNAGGEFWISVEVRAHRRAEIGCGYRRERGAKIAPEF